MPTITQTNYRAQDKSDTKNRREFKYTGPTSYVTGGDSMVPADVGLGQIHVVGSGGGVLMWSGTAVRLAVWDSVNQKLVWYVPNTGAEVANGTDLSTFTSDIEVIGL